MLTIGQLARYTSVPAKTVRYYHSIGLLPEPARDTSGYRRYGAGDAIALMKVRALAEAGIPLDRSPPCSPPAPRIAPPRSTGSTTTWNNTSLGSRKRAGACTRSRTGIPRYPPEWPSTWTFSNESG